MNPTLEAIIAPGTDADVRARYATLAQRAAQCDFGLLEDDVIVVDTEETGLDFRSCEVIEIAAARLRGRVIVDSFDTFVRPKGEIPPEIVRLTGITNEMVADAPLPAEALGAFEEFAGDAPIIAHNAVFDRHFLEKAAGHKVGAAWVDSLEFSRIALPCLTSYKLMDLSRAFDLVPSTHRADADVEALCGLWRVLLTAASDLPAGLLNYLANFYPEVAWSYRPIFAQLAAAYPDVAFSMVDERAQRCSQQELNTRPDAFALEEQGPLVFPAPDEIAAQYGRDGIVGRMYEGFESRDEQVTMARAVTRAFSTSTNIAVEAGTGVGKSMAYLLPAALVAQGNGITVGVATKSNALTDQLVHRELPLLSSALDKPLSYVALKGYDNYPCLRKVERLARIGSVRTAGSGSSDGDAREMPAGLPAPSEDMLNAIAAIFSFATQSAQGDMNSLGIRWGKIKRSDLTSSSGECQKRRCPYFPNRCFLHGARRRAAARRHSGDQSFAAVHDGGFGHRGAASHTLLGGGRGPRRGVRGSPAVGAPRELARRGNELREARHVGDGRHRLACPGGAGHPRRDRDAGGAFPNGRGGEPGARHVERVLRRRPQAGATSEQARGIRGRERLAFARDARVRGVRRGHGIGPRVRGASRQGGQAGPAGRAGAL